MTNAMKAAILDALPKLRQHALIKWYSDMKQSTLTRLFNQKIYHLEASIWKPTIEKKIIVRKLT